MSWNIQDEVTLGRSIINRTLFTECGINWENRRDGKKIRQLLRYLQIEYGGMGVAFAPGGSLRNRGDDRGGLRSDVHYGLCLADGRVLLAVGLIPLSLRLSLPWMSSDLK